MNAKKHGEMLSVGIAMPRWLEELESGFAGQVIAGDEAKLRFVVDIANKNVINETGGPFAAAVFDLASERLIAVGINVVVPARQSWAHAEMTAFSRAQDKLDRGSLRGCMLATSGEPCAMCSGATPWSGVGKMIYAAPREMAEKIGFDEGYKGERWREEFARRGIQITGPLLGEDAFAPFALYAGKHGRIY